MIVRRAMYARECLSVEQATRMRKEIDPIVAARIPSQTSGGNPSGVGVGVGLIGGRGDILLSRVPRRRKQSES
jgi:hypothetical protein